MRSNNLTSTDFTVLRSCSFVFLALLAYTYFASSEWISYLPLRCPLAWLGFSCPTCGLGHSLLSALQGDWQKSVEYHPLGIAVLGMSVVAFVVGMTFPTYLVSLFARIRRKMNVRSVATLSLLYLCWHIWRLKGFPS